MAAPTAPTPTPQERKQARDESYRERRKQAQEAENKALVESAQGDLNVAEMAIRRALRKMSDVRVSREKPTERRAFQRLAQGVSDALGVIKRAQNKTGSNRWEGLKTNLHDPDLTIEDPDLNGI